jgi:hypothetical protein
VLATIDRENNLVEVNGKLVYLEKKHLEMYLSRIEFLILNQDQFSSSAGSQSD